MVKMVGNETSLTFALETFLSIQFRSVFGIAINGMDRPSRQRNVLKYVIIQR